MPGATRAAGRARGRTAVVVTSYPGQPGSEYRRREERAGTRPRKGPTALADLLAADLIDADWMSRRAHPLARVVARRLGLPLGQIAEVFLRRRRYSHVCAWADRIGLPLAMLFRVVPDAPALTLRSVDLLAPKKAVWLSRLRAHRGLRAILFPSTVQLEATAGDLRVPRDMLHFVGHGVDTAFWRSQTPPGGRRICSVGWEARDYPTLLRAIEGLDVELHAAVGTVVLAAEEEAGKDARSQGPDVPAALEPLKGSAGYDAYRRSMSGLPAALVARAAWSRQLGPLSLRALYEGSRFAVIPLQDVPFDAGATAILEAMSMGRPVIATRTRGQVELVRDGETGLCVPPGDPAALRAAIERLLEDDDECVRMGQAARREAVRSFALEPYLHRLTAFLAVGEQHATKPPPS